MDEDQRNTGADIRYNKGDHATAGPDGTMVQKRMDKSATELQTKNNKGMGPSSDADNAGRGQATSQR